MSKTYKFWTGVLAFLPFLMTIAYVLFMFSFMMKMMSMDHHQQEVPDFPMEAFAGIFAMAGLMMLTTFGAMIFFIVQVVNNKRLASDERLMWILIIIFANVIAFPIYWFMRIRKQQPTPPASQEFSSQTMER